MPQAGTGALANYTILKTTDYGKSMTRDFPAQTSARQVVRETVPDLVAFFGGKPRLVGVYRDQKYGKSACVFFSESLNGQPVKGISVIKVTDDATHEWLKGEFAHVPLRFFRQMARCVNQGHLVAVEGLAGLPADFVAQPPRTSARFAFSKVPLMNI